ncbi:MAG: hypothetical protein HYZ53_09495 [Planctomycetes bacterium]|nr:hypothetical protein [Planctomycetota bacterium]
MQYQSQVLRLRILTPGALLPWIGPALRGMVARSFKAQVCRLPIEERASLGRYCSGCRLHVGCPYGETFEPEAGPEAKVFRGQDQVARPIVLAPYFPLPAQAGPGDEFPVRLTLVGAAGKHRAAVIEALDRAGRPLAADTSGRRAEYGGGLGLDGIGVQICDEDSDERLACDLSAADLPAQPESVVGRVPRLTLVLSAPLFLRSEGEDGCRQAVQHPTFSHLLRASLRAVGRAFATYDAPLAVDFAALKAAAEGVPRIRDSFQPFYQGRSSSRTGERWTLQGVVGEATFADVPLALVPWLVWGGRVHVGEHRVAGAGTWRIVLD